MRDWLGTWEIYLSSSSHHLTGHLRGPSPQSRDRKHTDSNINLLSPFLPTSPASCFHKFQLAMINRDLKIPNDKLQKLKKLHTL